MNMTIILIEALILIIVFSAMILIPLMKNPGWRTLDYPQDIQNECFRSHEAVPSACFSETVLLKRSVCLLIALALLLGIISLPGAQCFWLAFAVSYGLWTVIDWYDCFVLDWIFFVNLEKVGAPGYRAHGQSLPPKYDFIRSCWGCSLGSSLVLQVLLNNDIIGSLPAR